MIKKLGQHFLINYKIIQKIVKIITCYYNNDYIIEIGTGYGAITFSIIDKDYFKHLFLIEIDNKCVLYLKKKINSIKITIIHKDILKINLYKLCSIYNIFKIQIIGNLPFYISKSLLLYFLKYIKIIKNIIILLQKEVGIKLLANYNTKKYCKLSIIFQFFFNIKSLLNISKKNFNPTPKINGTLILLIPKKIFYNFTYYNYIIKIFFNIIKIIFTNSRKTIFNCLIKNKIISKKKLLLLNFNIKLRPNKFTGKDYFFLSYCIFLFNLFNILQLNINNKY